MVRYTKDFKEIETLELLKNKTFRFSSLGIVDDMEEALTSDFILVVIMELELEFLQIYLI